MIHPVWTGWSRVSFITLIGAQTGAAGSQLCLVPATTSGWATASVLLCKITSESVWSGRFVMEELCFVRIPVSTGLKVFSKSIVKRLCYPIYPSRGKCNMIDDIKSSMQSSQFEAGAVFHFLESWPLTCGKKLILDSGCECSCQIVLLAILTGSAHWIVHHQELIHGASAATRASQQEKH